LGITYYYASQAISALKNFSKIKVISIDKYYHPNADMSFGNLKKDVFIEALDEVIEQLPGKKLRLIRQDDKHGKRISL